MYQVIFEIFRDISKSVKNSLYFNVFFKVDTTPSWELVSLVESKAVIQTHVSLNKQPMEPFSWTQKLTHKHKQWANAPPCFQLSLSLFGGSKGEPIKTKSSANQPTNQFLEDPTSETLRSKSVVLSWWHSSLWIKKLCNPPGDKRESLGRNHWETWAVKWRHMWVYKWIKGREGIMLLALLSLHTEM